MKYLILLSSLFMIAYGLSSEAIEVIKKYGKEIGSQCKAELDATDEDLKSIHHLPPITEKGKCFLGCIYKKTGCLDANGKISKPGALAGIEKFKNIDNEYYSKIRQVLNTCLEKVTDLSNECETGLAMFKCFETEKKEVGLSKIGF